MRVLDVKRKQNIAKKATCISMAFLCAFTSFSIAMPIKVQAANKLTLKAARSLAIENSTEYESAEDKIIAKLKGLEYLKAHWAASPRA